MKVKHHILKENVTITLTPDEVFDLIVICEGDIVLSKQYMRNFKRNSKGWKEFKKAKERAVRMQNKFITIRNTGPIEEIEI